MSGETAAALGSAAIFAAAYTRVLHINRRLRLRLRAARARALAPLELEPPGWVSAELEELGR